MYWQHMVLFDFYLFHRLDKGMLDKICQHWWKSQEILSAMQENTAQVVHNLR